MRAPAASGADSDWFWLIPFNGIRARIRVGTIFVAELVAEVGGAELQDEHADFYWQGHQKGRRDVSSLATGHKRPGQQQLSRH
jgi:hypothetical protein